MQNKENLEAFSSDHLFPLKLLSLVEISKRINSLLKIDDLLAIIIEKSKELLNTEACSLMLADYEKQVLIFHVVSGEGKELETTELPLGVGIAGTVAQSGEPLIVNDAQNDPRWYKEADKMTNSVTRNILCVPMIADGLVIGVLEAINTIDREGFNEDNDLLLMMAIAEQAAISITNNKLYDRIKARVEELSSLHDVSQLAMRHHERTEDMLRISLSIVARAMHCKYISVLLRDPIDNTLKLLVYNKAKNEITEQTEPSTEEEIARQAFESCSSVFSENIHIDPRYKSNMNFLYTKRSFISIALQAKSGPFGVLNAFDRLDGNSFDSYNVTLFETIANHLSKIHENILLFKEKENTIRFEEELRITRKLQDAILPKRFPVIKGVDMYACSKSAQEVGGDFYDYFHSSDFPDEFIATIADVSGKSISAALFMATARSILRAQILNRHTPNPARLFESATDLILSDSDSGMFVTSFMIHCNLLSRQLTYSSAGHNDPLLLRKGEKEFINLHTTGKPLAILPGAKYADNIIEIKDGDLLVMYTDGLVEANDRDGEEFGMERVEEALLSCRDLSAKEIAQTLLDKTNAFAAGVPQFDDITLFIIKFNFDE
jgi:sigma-B regulation protein RsbU (phosphoserine phosphatase)